MTTTVFEIANFGKIQVIHHSDWSGVATVLWKDPSYYKGHNPSGAHEVEIPAPLLMELGRQAAVENVKDRLIRFLEDLED